MWKSENVVALPPISPQKNNKNFVVQDDDEIVHSQREVVEDWPPTDKP